MDLQKGEICNEINNILGNMFEKRRVSVNDTLQWRREVMVSAESMQSKTNDKFGQRGGGNEKLVFAGRISSKSDPNQRRKEGLTG